MYEIASLDNTWFPKRCISSDLRLFPLLTIFPSHVQKYGFHFCFMSNNLTLSSSFFSSSWTETVVGIQQPSREPLLWFQASISTYWWFRLVGSRAKHFFYFITAEWNSVRKVRVLPHSYILYSRHRFPPASIHPSLCIIRRTALRSAVIPSLICRFTAFGAPSPGGYITSLHRD